LTGTALWVAVRRLEKSTVAWPKPGQVSGEKLKLAPGALAMLTDGVDRGGGKRAQNWRLFWGL